MATIQALHHVAMIVPTERLEEARRFYSGVLRLVEAPRPDESLGRPGIWYRLGTGELHIQCRDAAEPDTSDRHPALIVDDVPGLKDHLRANQVDVENAPMLLGRERFFCRDPFGSRIEFMSLP